MKNIFLSFIAMLLIGECVFADSDSTAIKKQGRYFASFGMGSMIGCSHCQITGKVANLSVSLVNGFRVGKRWSLGAGIGFDSYEDWRTMPIFASTSFDLLGKKNRVYLQLNYGYSFATINNSKKEWGYIGSHAGETLNPQIGYRVNYGAVSTSFSVGYKFQRAYTEYGFVNYYPYIDYMAPPPINTPNTRETRIDMSRVVFGMTIGWR